MLHLLKRHLLSMRAWFDFVLSVTYAAPAATLSKFVTPGLHLDDWKGLGFFAAAFVQTRQMRPALLPRFLGRGYFFGGYRLFCRYRTDDGRELRGLRILRSDTDRRMMASAGNLLTHYNYHVAKVNVQRIDDLLSLRVVSHDGCGDAELTAELAGPPDFLPDGSPFSTVHEARRFAGPMPFTFDYEAETNSIIRVEGVRKGWKPRLLPVSVRKLSFLDQKIFADTAPLLASCFYLEGIDYHWKRGIRKQLGRAD
jgi:Uncharacterized conserved protein (COG2071)